MLLLGVRFVQEEGEVANSHDAVAGEEGLHTLEARAAAEGAEHLGVVPAHTTSHGSAAPSPVALNALACPRLHLGDWTEGRRQQLKAHLQQDRLQFIPLLSST